MNWSVWDRVEAIVRLHNLRPIVAVVPDNQDPHLRVSTARPDFWDRVQDWAQRGWTIAVHGFQHVYSTKDAGIVGLNQRSEFAGVPLNTQARLLDAALSVFHDRGIYPTTWVAPGHSFDWATVECLRARGIRIVSDGFYFRPVSLGGCVWIPQQLWRLRAMPSGVWTVCYHVNRWREPECETFGADVRKYAAAMSCVEDAVARHVAAPQLSDRVFCALYRRLVFAKRRLSI